MTKPSIKSNKRFIAAAVCPECKQQDKVFTYLENNCQWKACANCNFKRSMDERVNTAQNELATRVNQVKLGEQPLGHETALETVKLIDPK